MKNIRFIWGLMDKVRWKQLLIFGVVAIYVLINLVSPLIFSFLIDNVINQEPITQPLLLLLANLVGSVDVIRENLWIGALLIVGLNMILGYVIFIRGKWNAEISETVACNLRNQLYHHLQLLPYSYHVKVKTGDLLQRCTSDVETIRRFLAGQLSEMVYSVLTAVIAIIILFNIHVKLAWIACAILPVIVLIAFVFFKRMQASFQKSDEAEGVLSTTIQENLSGMRVVRAFHQEKYEIDKLEKHNAQFRDLTYQVIRNLAFYWGGSDFVCLTQILVVILFGILEAQAGNLSTGNFFVFVSYEGMILWPMRNLGRILSDMGKMTVSIGRIHEILDTPIEDVKTGLMPDLKGDIEFKDVSFQYDDGDTTVIEGVNFTVKKGQTVAIMGPTGSGKSSLMYLLTRLYDCTAGEILINGVNIKEIQKEYLRKNVGIVLQEPFLFSRSIFDNIRIADPVAEKDQVYRVAKIASVHDVIQKFDLGYDTLVGEKGVTLSGGQKQRIAIARTLIKDTPILIFDDSLSAVDTQTDAAIRNELEKMAGSMTMFLITQRVSSAQHADQILVLEDKKITQRGTHEELIQQEGLYQRIYEIQTSMQKVGD
ncbi:MAG: ABC transporter ATP-binding protein [Erysipelotrichaceae bacterium]|nr:ABC transporter ATP-binding protein [Erysipelotrichaceae bacterium]